MTCLQTSGNHNHGLIKLAITNHWSFLGRLPTPKSQSSANTVYDYKFKNDEATLLLVAPQHCVILVHILKSDVCTCRQLRKQWHLNHGGKIYSEDRGSEQTNPVSNLRSTTYYVILTREFHIFNPQWHRSPGFLHVACIYSVNTAPVPAISGESTHTKLRFYFLNPAIS